MGVAPSQPVDYEVYARRAHEWALREKDGIGRDCSTRCDMTMLCWNAYLIPKWFVSKDNATCVHQAGRATGIGAVIATLASDIVVMQEVWGSSMPLLEAPIRHMHQVIPWCKSWGSTLLDTSAQFLSSRGGLWMAHRSDTTVFLDSRWRTFGFSNTKSKKGIVAARFRVYLNGAAVAGEVRRQRAMEALRELHMNAANGTGPRLDDALMQDAENIRNVIVINVHLDPTNENGAIDKQVAEINDFVCKEIAGDAAFCPNPKEISIILCGDFNFTPDSPCYRLLRSGMRIRDLYAERWNAPPAGAIGFDAGFAAAALPDGSADATYDYRTNGLAMWANAGRIDMQFAIDEVFPGDGRHVQFQRVECVHATILRQPKGSELSDHWPVSLSLRFQRSDPKAAAAEGSNLAPAAERRPTAAASIAPRASRFTPPPTASAPVPAATAATQSANAEEEL